MPAFHWIKWYIEIIDDPKMATLPDRLWRRFSECCLIAGRMGWEGLLPDTPQLAWALHMDIESLGLDLQQLAQIGVIERTINGWIVSKFAERQAASTSTQRSQVFRKRQKQDQYYGEKRSGNENATTAQRIVAQRERRGEEESDTEVETEVEVEVDALPANPLLAAFINYAKVPDFGTGRAAEALQEMTAAGVIPEDIQAAVAWMDQMGYSIRSLTSIVKPAITEAGKRKRGGSDQPKPLSKSNNQRVLERYQEKHGNQ